MTEDGKNQYDKKDIGGSCYLNKNCWLVKNLKNAPYNRCRYCDFRFRDCLFLRYQVVSLVLVFLSIVAFLLIERRVSLLMMITVSVLVIVYGYFFNGSTEKIIKINFFLKKTKDDLKELSDNLEDKVDEQTKELKAKNLHLQKLLKMRSEFLDIASHQLRTPVSVIKGTMEMMDVGDFDSLPAEEKKKYIKNAYEKSQKLQKIIADILITSELDTANFEVDKKTARAIDIVEMMEKVIGDIKFEAEERKIDILWQRPAQPLPAILGYEPYLHQAILNLLDNAIKYTPSTGETAESRDKRAEPGKIIVSTALKGEQIIIQVKDNGIGIPKKELGQLFKKFSRASNARNMYTDGSGLGLFIIKEIVEGHHGQVSVESELGKGANFTVTLPIK